MKRWQRKPLRRFAGMILDLAETLRASGDDLLEAAEWRRPEPLRFPTASELMFQDIFQRASANYAKQAAANLVRDSAFFGQGTVWIGVDPGSEDFTVNRIAPHGD